jgi:hypothetical protein
MNNSFARLIDGMCATLRGEVLTRLDDEFARGQVFGVINVLNTFKARADWSPAFLVQQIGAQREALDAVAALLPQSAAGRPAPAVPQSPLPRATAVSELLAQRDEGNRAIGALLEWLDAERAGLPPETAARIESALRTAMRAEVDIELKNSPRPLFAEISSGRENS